MRKTSLLLAALLAVAVALWFYLPKTQSGELTVVISTGGEETERVKLNSFTETTVTHNGYTLRITADGSGVRVTDSDCPTQDCVHTGTITRAGQSIVCLPEQVVVQLTGGGGGGPDAVLG